MTSVYLVRWTNHKKIINNNSLLAFLSTYNLWIKQIYSFKIKKIIDFPRIIRLSK